MAYTTIDDPSAYFQTALYTSGTGASITVTNDGNSDLQPDWIWIKVRNGTNNHNTFDTSRGVTNRLKPNTTDAEDSGSGVSVNSDGFATGTSLGDINNTGGANNYVAWQWKSQGGSTVSNTDGSITSTVQANTTAGFSIVTYTGTGSAGATVGHGLGAVADCLIVKSLDSATNWQFISKPLDSDKFLELNATDGQLSQGTYNMFNSTKPTSTIFTLGNHANTNKSGGESYVAYCFAEKKGYSKFGSYKGNGHATDGPFVYLGFKPSWLLYRNVSRSENWIIEDIKRNPFNRVAGAKLQANVSDAETTETRWGFDFLSNGFKVRNTEAQNANNGSGETIIYMAFAEHPFVGSDGVPTTAR